LVGRGTRAIIPFRRNGPYYPIFEKIRRSSASTPPPPWHASAAPPLSIGKFRPSIDMQPLTGLDGCVIAHFEGYQVSNPTDCSECADVRFGIERAVGYWLLAFCIWPTASGFRLTAFALLVLPSRQHSATPHHLRRLRPRLLKVLPSRQPPFAPFAPFIPFPLLISNS